MPTINQTIQTRVLNSAGAPARIQKLVIQADDGRKIVLDPTQLSASTLGQVLKVVSETELSLADPYPAGGSQYQVLQRDGSGNAAWDWVRWP